MLEGGCMISINKYGDRTMYETMWKCVSGGIFGVFSVIIQSAPLLLILLLFLVADSVSAFMLGRRVHRKQPNKATGKFKSEYATRVFRNMLEMGILIFLVAIADKYLLCDYDFNLANYITLFFCGVTFWSILENMSSSNDHVWAKALQKVMVDKTKRHFDIDLDDLLKEGDNGKDSDKR